MENKLGQVFRLVSFYYVYSFFFLIKKKCYLSLNKYIKQTVKAMALKKITFVCRYVIVRLVTIRINSGL